jgi:hypothetical protein
MLKCTTFWDITPCSPLKVDGRMTDELKVFGKERTLRNRGTVPVYSWGARGKPRIYTRCSGRDSNWAHPEYKPRYLFA